jgi:hypothetical protein
MSVNRYLPHVFVLPEDDANRQLANGFHLQVDPTRQRQMQVLPAAGGWNEVLERFKSNHVIGMNRYSDRFMVLLIDFDGHQERLTTAKAEIPEGLAERVFILGALTKPEALRQASLGSYEQIGLAMAKDCREGTETVWGHELLRHNAREIECLRQHVRPIVFPSN